MTVNNPPVFDHIIATNGNSYQLVVYEIGPWNMDTTSFLRIAHGLGSAWSNLRIIHVSIADDSESLHICLTGINIDGSTTISNGTWSVDATNVELDRATGGMFDGVDFDSVAINRGYVIGLLLQ